MDIFESLENLNVSEECFDEIMGLVEELLSEGEKVDNYYRTKLEKVNQDLASAKSHQRKLNNTVDKKTNKEYKKAVNKNFIANDAAYQDYMNASSHARELDQEFGGEHDPNDYTDKGTQDRADQAIGNLKKVGNQFSKEGKQVYASIKELMNKKRQLSKLADAHQAHKEDSQIPAKMSHGYSGGARRAKGKKIRNISTD